MKRIDSFPTNKINGVEYRAGHVFPFGASLVDDAVNFSVYSKDAVSCTLLLYHRGEKEPYLELTFPEEFRIGNVFTMMVFGLNIEELEYGSIHLERIIQAIRNCPSTGRLPGRWT